MNSTKLGLVEVNELKQGKAKKNEQNEILESVWSLNQNIPQVIEANVAVHMLFFKEFWMENNYFIVSDSQ